jgi:cytochrome c biogenesis protein CcmG/thiol:disulfide interchange protein DsbE
MSNRPNTKVRPATVPRGAASSPPASRRSWWIAGVLGLVGVLALLVAVFAPRPESDTVTLPGNTVPTGESVVPASDAMAGPVVVDGTALPPLAPGGVDAAVGQPAPTLEGTGLDGESLTSLTPGEPAVVMFVAHWCPHCQAEVPRLSEWMADEGLPEGVELVTVATANDPAQDNFPAGDWLHDAGWAVPTMLDNEDGAAAAAFGVSGYPFFVAVDAQGNVVARDSGEIGVEGVQALIAAAAATGQPAPLQ